ncbi:hypothetical protein [uncultured Empedobacter sp.]|uniref:hypothetical protein n=1 Tax=uncultured Empedobacter sp. TaxID=410844 RepID=UPI0025E9B68A|nr:hypothetical protein [uncultured Empedobacter sp.]
MNYTEDFKELYTKLLYNFISINVNEEAFNKKSIEIAFSKHKQIIRNPFDIDDGWVMNFIPKDIGVEINSNNKKETYEKLVSEIFCLNSVNIFENTIKLFNKVLIMIYENDNDLFSEKVNDFILIQSLKKVTERDFIKNIKNYKFNSNTIISFLHFLVKHEIEQNSKNIKLNAWYNKEPFSFLNKMKNYRNQIVHNNSVYNLKTDEKIYLYDYDILNENNIYLRLKFTSMKNILEAYKQVIYIIYKALNLKYGKEDELNLLTSK